MRELSAEIGRRLTDAFPTEVWVRGEIHDLHRARSGHVYFTLRETGDDRTGDHASLAVMLSSTAKSRVNRLLTKAGDGVRMNDGTEVRIRGRLDWYAATGKLQLRMSSIDPAFTLGQLALARARLLEALRADGSLARNGAIPFPVLPLRVGLITSAGSAAEADVIDELLGSGYPFAVRVADVRVQGIDAPDRIVGALAAFDRRYDLDVVVLVRGGGATSDLAAFDHESVARAIAACHHPVVVGVGHETDASVADAVAHTSAKTPTAAARVLVAAVADAAQRTEAAWDAIRRTATLTVERRLEVLDRAALRLDRSTVGALREAGASVDRAGDRLVRGVGDALGRRDAGLVDARSRLSGATVAMLRRADERLDRARDRLEVVDPVRTLARGWSITTTADGAPVRRVGDVAPGDRLRIRLADGTVDVTVLDRTTDPEPDGAPA